MTASIGPGRRGRGVCLPAAAPDAQGRVPPAPVRDMWWLAGCEDHLPAVYDWLSVREADYANSLRFTKRRSEFLVARFVAKQALCRTLSLPATPDALRRVEVRHAASGAPLAYFDGGPLDLPISLSDRAGWAVCLLGGRTGRIGCDLELVEPRSEAFVRDYLTPAEQSFVFGASDDDARQLAANLVWSAKESALKVLTTGLRRDTRSVEVCVGVPDPDWGALVVRTTEGTQFPGLWRRFGQFVLTLAAEYDVTPPAALEETLLAVAVPAHSWLPNPAIAQPLPTIPRSSASTK